MNPFELLVSICTNNLSESNKDLMVGLLADACCERLEHYISQVILYDSIIKLTRVNYLACVKFKHFSNHLFQYQLFG